MGWYRVRFAPIVVDIEAYDVDEAIYSATEAVLGTGEWLEVETVEEDY